VNAFHYISPLDGIGINGSQHCRANFEMHFQCNWLSTQYFNPIFTSTYKHYFPVAENASTVQLFRIGVYNMQSTYRSIKQMPHNSVPFKYVMIETSEAIRKRYTTLNNLGMQFENRKKDTSVQIGYSSTYPISSIQRIYPEAFLNENDFLPLEPFEKLIKGAVFIASNCQKSYAASSQFPFYTGSKRETIVIRLRELGLRVDGLGGCLQSSQSDSPILTQRSNSLHEDLKSKRIAISKYMFYLAFENESKFFSYIILWKRLIIWLCFEL